MSFAILITFVVYILNLISTKAMSTISSLGIALQKLLIIDTYTLNLISTKAMFTISSLDIAS